MKKLFLFLSLFSLLSFLAFAKTTPMPAWVTDYRSVFPDSEYLAQRGTGDSSEKAITDASGALARYFQMTVNANISTTMTEEKTSVVDEVQVRSDVELFGMQFTEPYHLKKDKRWYAVAYIKRSDAWTQYKPKVDQSSRTFTGKYKKIEEEKDHFSRIALCRNAWESAMELLTKLEYARIISPKDEAAYKGDRDRIAKIPVLLDEARSNCTIYLDCPGDYNNMLTTSISAAFTKAGMTVLKNQASAKYICNVDVDNNVIGSDPLSISPSISIKMADQAGKAVYAYEYVTEEKTVSYTLENAKKKGYPKFVKDVEKSLSNDLDTILKQ